MASYNRVQAAVLSRPGCRLILARSLLTSKNTCVAGVYPCSYSQALCMACQHWGLTGGLIVVLASACERRYLWAVLYSPPRQALYTITWTACPVIINKLERVLLIIHIVIHILFLAAPLISYFMHRAAPFFYSLAVFEWMCVYTEQTHNSSM